ncbi:hypothetical protein LTR08_001139 [Meristemomyces frigidus]|nr:hypothetical protein LTR08_001139 [Meristemomyces frigidus]
MDVISLALELSKKVQEIADRLQKQGLPLPSMQPDAPSPDFIPANDSELQKIRGELVTSARLLADVFTGPRRYLTEYITISNHNSMTIHVIYSFNIPGHVPLEGTISFPDLAKAAGVDEDKVTRILRYAMLQHIFTEPTPGQVGHSAVSRLLVTGSMNMDMLGHSTEDMWPGCLAQVEALRNIAAGPTTANCGVAIALGGGKKNFMEIIADQPDRVRRLGNAMAFMNAPGGFGSPDKLLTGFDWRGLGKATVVDVGGSLGHTAIDVLKHADQLAKVIVQDLPEVIDQANSQPKPPGLESRLQYQKASFLEPQPQKDADLYYFRLVFHDWPTDKCIEILQNLVPSMKSGSRLLIKRLHPLPERYRRRFLLPHGARVGYADDGNQQRAREISRGLDGDGGGCGFWGAGSGVVRGLVLVFRKL